jgi:hypothetical protein
LPARRAAEPCSGPRRRHRRRRAPRCVARLGRDGGGRRLRGERHESSSQATDAWR